MRLQELVDYFLAPEKTGYDIPKTLVYALFLVVAVFLLYKALKRLKVKIDKRFAVALSPYVVFGGALRVLQDAGLVSSYWFVTPGIYFFIASIISSVFLISLALERRGIPYFKTLFTIGLLLLAFTVIHIKPVNFYGSFLVLAFFFPWVFLFGIVKWGTENKLVMLVQLFDATTTFVALKFFGYYEQHVLPTFLISLFGPGSFIILKLFVIFAVLIAIDRLSEDKEFNSYLKLLIGILGAATGSRDFISLLALV